MADAVREKVAGIIVSKKFMSVMSDGSQARKTNDEKELILVRVERAGIPIYIVTSLLEMASRGGTDANSIKLAIDSVFSDNEGTDLIQPGNVPMDYDSYRDKMISATADGANVNLGIYNGVLTQLKSERPWLVKIHCVNHRLELAIKDAVSSVDEFQDCDRFYLTLYFLMKNSGKLKSELKKASEALNITHYPLPKIHGTRFVNHRRKGFTKLLHNWPALITTFDNAQAAERGYRGETRAKIIGIARKLHSYPFLCKVAGYLDFLEKLSPLSLIFEKNVLMAYEVNPAIDTAFTYLEDMAEEEVEDMIDSYLQKFTIVDEDGLVTVVGNYPKSGHERKNVQNREYIDIELDDMREVDVEAIERARNTRHEGALTVIPLIQERFSSFSSELFQSMTWMDPQFWTDDRDYGINSLTVFINEFRAPLLAAGFDERKVFQEWKAFKITVNSNYKNVEATKMWEKMFVHKKREFPNMLLLGELGMCLSSSNSSVERIFSLLTIMLSDRRLRMTHETMEDMIIIAGNSSLWNEREKENLLIRATELYMQKRRYTALEPEAIDVENVGENERHQESSEESSDESSADESHLELSFNSSEETDASDF